MNGRVRAGVVVDARDLERACALEEHVDSLWVGGHIASRNPGPEPLAGLARLSAVIRTAEIGTAVLALPLYSPALVAKQVADLDLATGGRVVLGVGVGGEYPQEFSACQVPLGERGARADEALPLLRRLWSGLPVTHDGPAYPMADVQVHPAPARAGGPPVLVAGRSAAAVRRAALLGDGWMPYLFTPDRYARTAHDVRQVAQAAGRSLAGFAWSAFVFVAVDSDADRARDEAAALLGTTYGRDVRGLLGRVGAVGTPDDVVRRLAELVRAGAEHLVLAPLAAPRRHASSDLLLTTEVLPRVRHLSSAGREPALHART